MQLLPPGTQRPRRRRQLDWELITCGIHGHALVGDDAESAGEDGLLVVADQGAVRWHRCLRCDTWVALPRPDPAARPDPPDRSEIEVPLRGKALRDRIVLRLIAVDDLPPAGAVRRPRALGLPAGPAPVLATAARAGGPMTAGPNTAVPMLDVRDVSIAFGGLKAVDRFSLSLPADGLYGLIGPNGAGKTTAFNLLTGVYRPQTGTVAVAGERVDGRKPYRIVQAGMARTFQNIRLFRELSVLENVRKSPASSCTRTQSLGERDASHLLQPARRSRDGARRSPWPCWEPHRASPTAPTPPSTRTCRTAISGGWRSPARSPPQPKRAAARRTGRRHEPAGKNRAHGTFIALHPRAVQSRGTAHRARHETGDGHLPSGSPC